MFFALAAALLLITSLSVLLTRVDARGGGGHSYSSRSSSTSRSSSSGSSSRSSSSRSPSYGGTTRSSSNNNSTTYGGGTSPTYPSSGGGGMGHSSLFWFLFSMPFISITLLFLIVGVAIIVARSRRNAPAPGFATTATVEEPENMTVAAHFDALRKYDPNFSEILFTDFIYALYAQAQKARGRKDIDNYSSYLDASVIQQFKALAGPELKEVKGVIIGASHILDVSDPEQEASITISVQFETNYTEIAAAPGGTESANTWYAREQWTFNRRRDVLSRSPEKITALHCPKCGGGLEKNPDGSCAYCGVKIMGGGFDWYVTGLQIIDRVAQGPLLTEDVPEVGTDFPTVMQSDFEEKRRRFMELNPDFVWGKLETRIRYIFTELQQAWTTMQWERIRPYETDNVFQTHLFWITEYQRQRLRNVLENIQIAQIIPVKIRTDAFYEAITVRIFASMIDYTVDASAKVVCGNPRAPRLFTEYWTFMRRRGGRASDKENDRCPNCGAPLQINMAGICEFCSGKITSGEFDWVLSRIEQDESYQG